MIDQDVIDAGLVALIEADSQFNGSGNLMGFRSSMIKKAVSWELSRKRKNHQAVENMSFLAEELYVNKEPSDIFEIAKHVLKEHEYQIIELRFKDDMNYHDIAIKMNKTQEGIRYIINEAVLFLSMILKQEDF